MNQQDRPTIDRRIWSHSVQIVTIYHVKWLISDMTFIWILSMITSNMDKIWLYSSLPVKNVKKLEFDQLWFFMNISLAVIVTVISHWFGNLALSVCQTGNRTCSWRERFESECEFHPASKIQLKTKLFDPRSYTFCSITNSIFSVSPKTKNMS